MNIKKWVEKNKSLYDPQFEHDNCGVAFVANIDGHKSHEIVEKGLQVLLHLVHRGAVGGDDKTGDGAGLLSQIPHEFFVRETKTLNIILPDAGKYGVGMFFLPQDNNKRENLTKKLEEIITARGFKVLGWRDVPFRSDCLGEFALSSMPVIQQLFIDNKGLAGDELERQLYVLRRILENTAHAMGIDFDEFYVCSLSARTIVYKGMFTAHQMNEFYPDLHDKRYVTAMAIVHQRFSTNTFPSWPLAQPFRYLAHNGEINTLRGNINRMKARESQMKSELFGDDISELFPIIQAFGSDSACVDNAFELLVNGGRSVEHSMMMMVPEAFGVKYHMSQDKRAFYEYHTTIMEPWDGPAALVFSDGRKIGAVLDRNGLRPARYVVTKDNFVVLASEVGVLTFPPEDILQKGRLTPGKMFLVDLEEGRIVSDQEIKSQVSRSKPYRRWLEKNRIELRGLLDAPQQVDPHHDTIFVRQTSFGYTREDLTFILAPMAINGQEPVGSMGTDTPLAVLSKEPQLLFWYFKQLFAQVTNPAIDPYRESLVMSLMSFVGQERNILDETPEHCKQLKLYHPILSNDDVPKILNASSKGIQTAVLPMLFDPTKGVESLEKAIDNLCKLAAQKVDEGNNILILSDRMVDANNAPIPCLLATSAVHNYLINCGKRMQTGLVVETGEARDVMHFALLIGFGASAINPYLAFETLSDMIKEGMLPSGVDQETAIDNYVNALKKGLLKIFSKMGISTLRSYRGAIIFEAIGLSKDLINKYFPGTVSRISGIDLNIIAQEAVLRHRKAYPLSGISPKLLELGGQYHYRHNTEHHLLTPKVVATLQHAVVKNDYTIYKDYARQVNDQSQKQHTLRGLFKFRKNTPIPLTKVESVEKIVTRFSTGAMSYGSISREAHETLAIAMNRLGGKSNTGEGGEDERRFVPMPNGDSTNSAIKQVASGRFGVTINYLVHSNELQIKVAQGAKPGEGGQLPGHKVDETIAKTRHSTPGVTLISPPPHHDIYSIEDLAQLIHDLKNSNPSARISVKLVAEVGVGTIAAGVAKAKSDMVLISGYDGGTGASPISSIKHAGIPWELGLAETHQTLVLNSLRDRIRVQVDGKLSTGRDLAVAILLGAEEFGFSTMPLIAMGCIMMRKCHLNTCPVGIATQDKDLRKKFHGKPEYVVNFMRFIAMELREIMAELGFRTVDEMIGQVSKLEVDNAISHWKSKGLDFSALLADVSKTMKKPVLRCIRSQDHQLELSLDKELLKKCSTAIESKTPVHFESEIHNYNRTVGTMLSSAIAKKYGSDGLPPDTIHIKFKGSAGQSFGAFLSKGVTFELAGDTNDYLGKGMSGGRIIVYPPKESPFKSYENIIIGNTVLYGATSGEIFVAGVAGERFAVRNSGAVAVIEGVGDHGCEYMTGGVVVVLGETGRNFAAGMSGGIAFVYDKSHLFDTLCNLDMVDIENVVEKTDIDLLRSLIKRHAQYTGSSYSKEILDTFEEKLPYFVKVMPIEYRRALKRLEEQANRNDDTTSVTEEVFR